MRTSKKKQGPKATAVQDIKQELHRQGKCFITFRIELNAPIREIIREYLEKQEKGGSL